MARLDVIHDGEESLSLVEIPRRRPVRDTHALERRRRRKASATVASGLVRDALFGVIVGAVLLTGLLLGLKIPSLVERLLHWLT
jgi:hypothetical protein